MSKFKRAKTFAKKATALATVFGMAASLIPAVPMQVKAADFTGKLTEVKLVEVDKDNENIVWVTFNNDVQGKLTFLDNGIFRYNVDPSGEFSKYATPRSSSHKGRIPQYPDESGAYKHPAAKVADADGYFTVTSGGVSVVFDKDTAMMSIKKGNKTVMEETDSLSIKSGSTVQTLKKQDDENFYGGGMQNGRFVHTGESINIAIDNKWVDNCVTSPSPFYYTTEGYGVLRNTFQTGVYDFGKTMEGTVTATHSDGEFDAYYFVSDAADGRGITQDILQEYFKVTGNPALAPEYSFYLGHLNAYNRDAWYDKKPNVSSATWTIKGTESADSEGTTTYEVGMSDKFILSDKMKSESLNGEKPTVALDNYPDVETPYEYSARAVIDQYQSFDMPLGFFLPNDGYGAGYGQNGYWMTGGVNPDGSSSKERLAAVAANVENLKKFAEYAKGKGVETGLWTQSYLVPDSNPATEWHRLRDFRQEVKAGVTTLKTDVAWVGPGYSMQLDGVKTAYNIATEESGVRPNIISLNGWAGSHRYNGIWTGDQTGGKWEYIRFHIPTYIGVSLAGNPNVGSDMDGIFGGSDLISTRDYQWKTFTQSMLNMDGWGSYAKMPYTFGDPYTGINRMYLKIKSQLMPYLYTTAYSSSNIEVGNKDAGLPMIRAMHLEFPNDTYAYSKNMQYQYMYGKNVLVAPVYQETNIKKNGDDVRDNIYLPGDKTVWVDFFTGKQYQGGQILNNYDAPLWKLPVFVKNGAIIPQYEANNSPSQINKANRIVEFWPEGETDYTAVEDDGRYIENETSNDAEYGVIENVSYGDHVTTKYTSKVEGSKATLTAEKSTGTYKGYSKDKNTTFIVHVSKKPQSIQASNGTNQLTPTEAATKAAFDKAVPEAGKAVWFYDAEPAIETFASEDPTKETRFKEMVANVKVAPKLYVKLAAADAQAVAQTVVVNGFENDGDLPADQPNNNLDVPELTENVEAKTPTSITVNWIAVEGATSYDLMIDGRLNSIDGDALSFTYRDLEYASEHTFQIRSRNAEGYSEWSKTYTFASDNDPWRNTPVPKKITWPGGIYGNHKAELAFDQIFQPGDGGFHSDADSSGNKGINTPLTVEYDKAYRLDKIEYYPRDDHATGGNGTVTKMKVETSLDGVHWKEAGEYSFNSDNLMKTIELEEDTAARFIRFTALAALGNFFGASEIKVCTIEGDKGFAVGSTTLSEKVVDGDYTNMKNYLGTSLKDGNNFLQIQDRYGDINENNYYDVYDYAFTMFQLNDGTQKKGSVTGASSANASKEEVAADETFTVEFQVQGASNVNALGQIITYNSNKVEFVSVAHSDAIAQMEDLCVNKTYEDGSGYVNIAFANRGDKDLYSGDGTLVTLTMKAKEAISTSDTDVLNLLGLILIGPDYSTNGEICEAPTEIEKPDRKMALDEFNITMTNAELTTDDGSNLNKLIQQKSYAGLFDGKYGRDFEFLWNQAPNVDEEGNLPKYVTLPLTMHFALKEPTVLSKAVLYNANKANGYVTAASAKVTYADGSTQTKDITLTGTQQVDYSTFAFDDILTSSKAVTNVDITIQKALADSGEEATKFLTLAEVEFFEGKLVDETPVKYTQDEFAVTMTNAELPTDDGSNVSKLIQQKSYGGLFDEKFGRDFEFLYDISSNYDDTGKLPAYVTLPTTMHFTLNNPGTVSKLVVYNANKANGFITQVGAKVNYQDGTSQEKTIELTAEEQVSNAVFTFEDLFNKNKNAASVDVTFMKAIKTGGEAVTNMLTLAEIELFKGGKAGEDPNPPGPDDPPIGPSDPDPENPLAPGKKYAQDDFNITMTNDELPEDDGTNVTKMIQQSEGYDGLFNGSYGEPKESTQDANYREFELKWDVESNYVDGVLPAYIKVPSTIHLTMKKPGPVSQVIVRNAGRRNGYVYAISVKVNYEDGSSSKDRIQKLPGDEFTAYQDFSAFTLKYAENKNVKSVDITILRTYGMGGNISPNMMTLAELEVYGVLDRSELQNVYDQYKDTANPDSLYTAATWAEFEKALKAVEDLLESDDQAKIDKAIADLEKAFGALKTNREVLQAEYDRQMNVTNNGVYTKESWDVFQNALKDAKELLDNQSAAGSALEKAYTDLRAAAGALVRIDKSKLLAELLKYEEMSNDDGTYTSDSWAIFRKAVEDAKSIYDSSQASQKDIDDAAASLEPAFNKLVKNSTYVQDEVNKLETSVTNTNNSYTQESWNAYQAALKVVKDKLAAGAAPAEISAAYADLQKAYQALQKADSNVQPPAPVEGLKKGEKHTYKNVVYKVLNVSKKTVAAAGLANKNVKTVTIQPTVTIKGVKCKVVEVSANAFKGAKKPQSVVIGANVTTIGKNAFNNCKALKKVTFKGTSVPKIKSGAFKNTKSGITVNVPKKMKKAKRSQLSSLLKSRGMKKLKLKAK